MHSVRLKSLRDRPALAVAGLGPALILAGALIWFVPYLTQSRRSVAEIPSPPALRTISEFAISPGQQACMSSVTVTPNSQLASFRLRSGGVHSGAQIELVLRGSGYESRTRLAAGYAAGEVTLPIVAPRHALVATACFVNRGRQTALLDGTTEPRTTSRSATRIDGRMVAGDIPLAFLNDRRPSLLDRTTEIFDHASNLTDHLVPTWLIWTLAVLVAFGVPVATTAALYLALKEDDAASAN